MSRDSAGEPVLTGEQQETWFAYMRVMLRLGYEMNRQLQTDSDLSLPDYDVLNALADSPGHRLQLTTLATRLAWERSRLSHHLQRMDARGLVERSPSASDRRATDAVLTDAGLTALRDATPGHAALVRRMFFDGLDPALLPALRTALEQVHEQVLATGTLPRPAEQTRLPGLQTGS
ncbi:MarR family winged helix-turn-helix transcriptional regulator [Modestobacter versicolor]|uniref:MarR family transcriptional regulator n=1 Tax=Modestobacter versicolor TaxID=429133 RepID=A0A323VC26_9ACTN|nr:MarR family winged helix-turn-helix transcriptional regulator [Modestobacter versicolor]MBB3677580.1 DNA-binding MarR family transcriptional regulator [Modestobacter versicolor]PZA21750.1 MarR family transcriptional regulator [Modestobacter versicolor]